MFHRHILFKSTTHYFAEPAECGDGEFQCMNRKCVKKIFYCDGEDDCGDLSDEPSTCSKCHSYLCSIVHEQKMCEENLLLRRGRMTVEI